MNDLVRVDIMMSALENLYNIKLQKTEVVNGISQHFKSVPANEDDPVSYDGYIGYRGNGELALLYMRRITMHSGGNLVEEILENRS